MAKMKRPICPSFQTNFTHTQAPGRCLRGGVIPISIYQGEDIIIWSE